MTQGVQPIVMLPDSVKTGKLTRRDVLQFIRYAALLDLRLPQFQLLPGERMNLSGHLCPAGREIVVHVAQGLRWAPRGLVDEYGTDPDELEERLQRGVNLRGLAQMLREVAQRADDMALVDEATAIRDAMQILRPAVPEAMVVGSTQDRRRLPLGTTLRAREDPARAEPARTAPAAAEPTAAPAAVDPAAGSAGDSTPDRASPQQMCGAGASPGLLPGESPAAQRGAQETHLPAEGGEVKAESRGAFTWMLVLALTLAVVFSLALTLDLMGGAASVDAALRSIVTTPALPAASPAARPAAAPGGAEAGARAPPPGHPLDR